MKKHWVIFILGTVLAVPLASARAEAPQAASGQVVVNEIAWMGSSASPSDEWIELANTGGAPVDLAGWTLSWNSTTIKLARSIDASGYYLVERTDDNTVPNAHADLVASFGHGLPNTGATLVLKNASGDLVDTVDGGANWSRIGGDTKTHDTPQRQASGSWVTAAPTPRAINATIVPLPVAVVAQQSSSPTPQPSSKKPAPAAKSVVAKNTKAQAVTPAYEENAAPAAAGAANGLTTSSLWLWVGLLALLLLAALVGVFMLDEQKKRSLADEFEIVEHSEE